MFILVDSRLKVSLEKKSHQIQAESSDFILNPDYVQLQGWRSGESARLPPMWSGFDSRTRRHMWVEFVVGSRPCSERFFSGYSGFPLSSKTNISKFKFDLDTVEEEPPSGSTANPHLFIYLFYLSFIVTHTCGFDILGLFSVYFLVRTYGQRKNTFICKCSKLKQIKTNICACS